MRRKIYLFCLAVFLAISINSQAQVPSLNPINGVVPAILNSAGVTQNICKNNNHIYFSRIGMQFHYLLS